MEHHRMLCNTLLLAAGLLDCTPSDPSGGPATPGMPTVPGTPAAPSPGTGPGPQPGRLPPPISGGTLLVTRDGKTVVAADPDRDRVWIVDLQSQNVSAIVLKDGDQPGRLIEDGARRVHVALRGGGALATIDLGTQSLRDRRAVCPAPRGVAYDGGGDVVYVACATGELVTLPAGGGQPTRTVTVQPDLRDVVVQGTRLFVSTFRAAQLLELDGNGQVIRQSAPKPFSDPDAMGAMTPAEPDVAWRTIALPDGSVAMLHQRAQATVVPARPRGYGLGGRCSGVVHAAMTVLDPPADPGVAAPLDSVVLPVDAAISPDGTQMAIAVAGGGEVIPGVFVAPLSSFKQEPSCLSSSDVNPNLMLSVVAVAYDLQGRLLMQTREPAAIYMENQFKPIALPGASRYDLGHAIFHGATPALLACASCHPEAGEDGRVWQFMPDGPRRTKQLLGGILGTEPFHWSGNLADFDALMTDVFIGRMSGPSLGHDAFAAVAHWIDGQPAPAQSAPTDPAAVERGMAIFQGPQIGCAGCHNGPKWTSNQIVDVGTGGTFKVPRLVGLASRAPYLHDGCAATLRDRFGACGGDQHGASSQLSEGQISDLVAYLETL